MATHKGIKNILKEYTNRMRKDLYGICDTTELTNIKTVILQNTHTFKLEAGVKLMVKFNYSCNSDTNYIRVQWVDSEGVTQQSDYKNIKERGLTANNLYTSWKSGETKEFVYDGTYWQMLQPISMPIGSIYIQFPGRREPNTLFGGRWKIIDLSGIYLRAEGGSAENFGAKIIFKKYEATGQSSSERNRQFYYSNDVHEIKIGDCFYWDTTLYKVVNTGTVVINNVTYRLVTFDHSIGNLQVLLYYVVPEGLPEITGWLNAQQGVSGNTSASATIDGVTYHNAFTNDSVFTGTKNDSGSGGSHPGYTFRASNSNSIYGSSEHVTPTYLTIRVWERDS